MSVCAKGMLTKIKKRFEHTVSFSKTVFTGVCLCVSQDPCRSMHLSAQTVKNN